MERNKTCDGILETTNSAQRTCSARTRREAASDLTVVTALVATTRGLAHLEEEEELWQ